MKTQPRFNWQLWGWPLGLGLLTLLGLLLALALSLIHIRFCRGGWSCLPRGAVVFGLRGRRRRDSSG